MKALVTGCAGFIGSHIVDRLLKDGYEVTGIDCFTDYYPQSVKESNISGALMNKKFTLITRNILEMDEYPDVDHVFHLAAQPGVRASWGKSFGIYVQNNIEVTQRLLEFYKDRQLKKFVYSSSSSVYGNVPLPMREGGVSRPVSPYGVSKLAAENLCYLYYKNYGLPAISLRYFTVYGPRIRPDLAINKFAKAIIDGKAIDIYGDGTQTRDFTFVSDIVDANILAARSDADGETFNVGGGSNITVKEMLKIMEDELDKKAIIRYVEKQKGDVENTRADIDKARTFLKWVPRYDIYKGLHEYIASIEH